MTCLGILPAASPSFSTAATSEEPPSSRPSGLWVSLPPSSGISYQKSTPGPGTTACSRTIFTGKPRLSKRHRVRDNLLDTGRFCPVIRRTKALTRFVELDLASRARETVGRTGAHLVARAASFMLLADSRASFAIENERPPRRRLERWGRAVLQAGKNPLTLDEIIRLQRVLIEDTRFVRSERPHAWRRR